MQRNIVRDPSPNKTDGEHSLHLPDRLVNSRIYPKEDILSETELDQHSESLPSSNAFPNDGWDKPANDNQTVAAELPLPDQGYGEARKVVKLLADAGIKSCVVDVAALNYYGCPFVLENFKICVPTNQFDVAIDVLQDQTCAHFKRLPRKTTWNPSDPLEECERFGLKGHDLEIYLVPADSVCLEPVFEQPDSILVSEESGLPFPRLKYYVQSALDSGQSSVADDLVDGMNLTEEWSREVKLNFSHKILRNGVKLDQKEYWLWLVNSKQKRMGIFYDPEVYASKYRMHKEGDMTKLINT